MIQKIIKQSLEKYMKYSDAYTRAVIELQKRTAQIFILLFTIYAILAYFNKRVAFEQASISIAIIIISLIHYTLFHCYVKNHPKSLPFFSSIYCVLILEILIGAGTILGDGISFIAIDVSMILIALTILIPIHYWVILGITLLLSIIGHIIWIMHLPPLTTYEIHSWISYAIEYAFLCLFALIINLAFSRMKFKEIEAEQTLLLQSKTDSLTGLFNRAYIEDYVNNTETGLMMCIDLDNFKKTNDSFGHREGDELLIKISQILKKHFQDPDCIARIGGDEFLVFVPNIIDCEIIVSKIKKLLNEFPIIISQEKIDVNVSLSVGIAWKESKEITYEMLYKMSDEAMYKAKKGGKNRAVINAKADTEERVITKESF